jgi:hypothetical protein
MPTKGSIPSKDFTWCNTLCCFLALSSTSADCSGCKPKVSLPKVSSYDASKTAATATANGKDFVFQLSGRVGISSRQRRKSSKWLHDSGASLHCCNDKSLFRSITDHDPSIKLHVADARTVKVEFIGTVVLQLRNQHGKLEQLLLQNVAYVPSFDKNILSVSRLWHENRIKTKFGETCYLKSDIGSKFALSGNSAPYNLEANMVTANVVFNGQRHRSNAFVYNQTVT